MKFDKPLSVSQMAGTVQFVTLLKSMWLGSVLYSALLGPVVLMVIMVTM